MAFGKRATPPAGGDVLEQMISHFEEGGSIIDFIVNSDPMARRPLRDIERSPEERQAELAYLSLLVRYGEPEVNTKLQAEIHRRDEVGREGLARRRAEADRAAAEKGQAVALEPFYVLGHSIWTGKYWNLLGVGLAMTAYDDWNVMFLAPDDASGLALMIPPYPYKEPPEIVAAATQYLDKIEPRFDAAYETAKAKGDIKAFASTVGDLQAEVESFAFKTRRFIEQRWRKLCTEQRRAAAAI